MVRKFFPLDKNYLLEEVQLQLQESLLTALVNKARDVYQQAHNPLGLNDAFSERISNYQPTNLKPLTAFYQNLSGVYRFKFGENQLGFLWDGKDHSEKYAEDWAAAFSDWAVMLCLHPRFVQAVLDLTVFLPQNREAHLAENRMNAVMQDLFELKIDRQKGIVRMKVA